MRALIMTLVVVVSTAAPSFAQSERAYVDVGGGIAAAPERTISTSSFSETSGHSGWSRVGISGKAALTIRSHSAPYLMKSSGRTTSRQRGDVQKQWNGSEGLSVP